MSLNLSLLVIKQAKLIQALKIEVYTHAFLFFILKLRL